MNKIDLLDMIHRIGFSVIESRNHVFYASKIVNGHRIVHGSDDIDILYILCVHTPVTNV